VIPYRDEADMSFPRVRLPLLAVLLLACQVSVLAVAPVSLALFGATTAATCECPGGMAGQACPMHRSPNREAGPEGGSAMRSSCSPDAAALLSLGMGLGVVPAPIRAASALIVVDVPALPFRSIHRVVAPDPFPPRV
jgi:hypothetical protein